MALIYDERIREKYGPVIALQLEEPEFDADRAMYVNTFIIFHRSTGTFVYKKLLRSGTVFTILNYHHDVIDSWIDKVLEIAERKNEEAQNEHDLDLLLKDSEYSELAEDELIEEARKASENEHNPLMEILRHLPKEYE